MTKIGTSGDPSTAAIGSSSRSPWARRSTSSPRAAVAECRGLDTAAPADISGYVIKDSDNGHAFTIPAATVIPANGYYVADVNSGAGGFGLGSNDSARLFAPANLVNPVDSYSWASHAAATYGRCPNGTGPMTPTTSPTRGAANDCPVAALAWPCNSAVSTADDVNVFGSNLSGLAYQPSRSGAPGGAVGGAQRAVHPLPADP